MKTALRSLGSLTGVGLVAVLMAHCGPFGLGSHPECPHSWNERVVGDLGLVSGAITNVPEYHDCQKFLVDDGKGGLQYGSLEAIFVHYKLDTVYYQLLSRHDAVDTTVVGQVASWGDYAGLGIRRGYDCLVLSWKKANTKFDYRAWMVPVGHSGRRCGESAARLLARPNKELLVNTLETADQSPPVSRWDWDPSQKVQYIGIACPSGWCELHGNTTFSSSPTRGGTNVISKGRYDEQFLAKYVSGKLSPEGSFGTVFADAGLDGRTVDKYFGTWLPAATVAIDNESPIYGSKLNFHRAPDGGVQLPALESKDFAANLNTVELCFSTAGHPCEGESPSYGCAADNWTDGTVKDAGTWWARVTPPPGKGTAQIRCAGFNPSPKVSGQPPYQPPPVVRWRWQKDDETVWISCPMGCCQVKVKA